MQTPNNHSGQLSFWWWSTIWSSFYIRGILLTEQSVWRHDTNNCPASVPPVFQQPDESTESLGLANRMISPGTLYLEWVAQGSSRDLGFIPLGSSILYPRVVVPVGQRLPSSGTPTRLLWWPSTSSFSMLSFCWNHSDLVSIPCSQESCLMHVPINMVLPVIPWRTVFMQPDEQIAFILGGAALTG